jgi:hypothetical protein
MSYIYPVDDGVRYRASISGARAFINQILAPPRPSTASTFGVYRISTPHLDRFTEYEAYNENWDGFGAEPITRETVDAARQLWHSLPRDLRAPDVAPGADGTIGFEWREGAPDNRKIFVIEIGPGALITARVSHPDGNIKTICQGQVGHVIRDIIASLLS